MSFKNINFVYSHVVGEHGEHVYKRVQSMRQSETTLQELLLSFHHVDLEELTQVIGLTTSTFTH